MIVPSIDLMGGSTVQLVGGREKQGLLYSLSEGGCFIETPRASMDGAQLRIVFALDGEEFEAGPQTVFWDGRGDSGRRRRRRGG